MRSNLAFLLAVVAACGGSNGGGGDDGGGVTPKLIAGGGVADAPIAGTMHVHVVEVDTATPIAGASVLVGGTTVKTNAAGLATFSVTGDQTVTATASGHAATTWIGVAGANVTLPLDPSSRTIPTAHVTGTIAGWNSLPSPSFATTRSAWCCTRFLDDPARSELDRAADGLRRATSIRASTPGCRTTARGR